MATSVNGCRKLSSHASVWTPTVEMNNNCDEQEQLAIFDHSCDHRSNWTPLTYVALVNGVQKLLLRFCSLISIGRPKALIHRFSSNWLILATVATIEATGHL